MFEHDFPSFPLHGFGVVGVMVLRATDVFVFMMMICCVL